MANLSPNGTCPAPVGRLAPTPSAYLHAGNLFAAIVAWLLVRSRNGRLVLRIEDLDVSRCKREYADGIMRDYERLGINWDNSDVMWQSERSGAYQEALEGLCAHGLVYPCFCSRADLHAASAPHVGETYIYAGTCREIPEAERTRLMSVKRHSLRLRVPDEDVRFTDVLQGGQCINLAGECGDFIVRRSDGVFAYQLAVTVDDLAQGVTQVVRGCDLVSSTPQQIHLRRLLDADAPELEFCHVPLLLDEQGKRLSKRDRDVSLAGLVEHFGSVEAFIGDLAGKTGLAPSTEPITLDGLLDCFSLDFLCNVKEIRWGFSGSR